MDKIMNKIDLDYLDRVSGNTNNMNTNVSYDIDNIDIDDFYVVIDNVGFSLDYNCLYVPKNNNLTVVTDYLKNLGIIFTTEYNYFETIINFKNIELYSFNSDCILQFEWVNKIDLSYLNKKYTNKILKGYNRCCMDNGLSGIEMPNLEIKNISFSSEKNCIYVPNANISTYFVEKYLKNLGIAFSIEEDDVNNRHIFNLENVKLVGYDYDYGNGLSFTFIS